MLALKRIWDDANMLRQVGLQAREHQLAYISATQDVRAERKPRPSKPNTAPLFASPGYLRGCAMVRRTVADEYRESGKPQDYADHCLRLATEYEDRAEGKTR